MKHWWSLMALILSACATTPPARLSGGPFSTITPSLARTRDLVGSRVRWGGTIAEVVPGKSETCFQVVGRPLDSEARPEEGDSTEGRYIACAAGFYDPAVYASGREITVTGTLESPQPGRIGEYEYRFPRVSADEVYLWPRWEPAYYSPFWYSPGPWGPW